MNKIIILFFIVSLTGCSFMKYPEEYAIYMENHNGEFTYDKICIGEACSDARQYLVDYKLAKEESEKNVYGKNFNMLTNHKHVTRSLNQDCFKTLSKLINDNYIGCNANAMLPELSTEEKHPLNAHVDTTGITLSNGTYVTVYNIKKPTSRQCAIEFVGNLRSIESYCKTTHWEDNPDTQAYYKEMADDNILRTGLVRPSFSFDQNNPIKDYHNKCITYKRDCEVELELVTGEFNERSTEEVRWDDNFESGYEERKYKHARFEISDDVVNFVDKLVYSMVDNLIGLAFRRMTPFSK